MNRDAKMLAAWYLKRAGVYTTGELTEAAERILADQPAATVPLGVDEIAEMLTTARAPDRCTPFEHEVTWRPFEAEKAPQDATESQQSDD